jgi:deoxyhypusine synthase
MSIAPPAPAIAPAKRPAMRKGAPVSANPTPITDFLKHHYRHFNAATVVDAAESYRDHIDGGGKMFLAMAGAMSTAELGLSLAEMIRQDKIHAISCTGANLEEDIFNLVAHDFYERVPNYRDLSPADELALAERNLCRVTDTCIPELEAMRRIEDHVIEKWKAAEERGERYFPHEFIYRLLLSGALEEHYQIDPRNSWVLAAAEKNLPLYIPGWEDSTLGNVFTAQYITGAIESPHTIKTGIEYMAHLVDWYEKASATSSVGFFQIGGGIAGDFAICAVPLLQLDLERMETPFWGYFCQISDSTTSYGSYSGAVPSEKITWNKIDIDTPTFMIESDATIVAPLVFATVLRW